MWNFLSMTLVMFYQLGFSFFPSKLTTMSTCPHAQRLWHRIATLLRHPFNYPEILGLTWSKRHPSCFQTWGKEKENGVDGWVRLCSVDGFVCGVGVPFLVWALDHCPQVCSPHGSQSLLDVKGGLWRLPRRLFQLRPYPLRAPALPVSQSTHRPTHGLFHHKCIVFPLNPGSKETSQGLPLAEMLLVIRERGVHLVCHGSLLSPTFYSIWWYNSMNVTSLDPLVLAIKTKWIIAMKR